MTDRTGKKLGNYTIIRQIGQGGFADVYLGQHHYLKTYAAIKVLQARLTQSELPVFLAEAQTVANLIHPHIVRVLEFGEEENTPFLVMDYCPGGTLRQRYPKGKRAPLHEVVTYIKQAAMALQYAHSRKVIHRDVKPENMLIGKDGTILLSDFGIALISQSSRYQKQDISGTVAYTAPEQLQGKAVFASDQYGLAIVAYEWLGGELPFRGSFVEIAGQHVSAPVPSLRAKVPELPEAVERVIQKALAKDAQQRFRTVQEFAEALEQASQGKMPALLETGGDPGGSLSTQLPDNASGNIPTYVKTVNSNATIPSAGSGQPTPQSRMPGASPNIAPPYSYPPPPVTRNTPSGYYGQPYTPPPYPQPYPVQPRKKGNAGYIATIVVLLMALLSVGCWAINMSLSTGTKSTQQGSNGGRSNSSPTAKRTPAKNGTFTKNIRLTCGGCNDPITVTITTITIDSATGRMAWNLSLYNTTTKTYYRYEYSLSEFSLQEATDTQKVSATGGIISGDHQSIPPEQKITERVIFSFIPFKGVDYTLHAKLDADLESDVVFEPVTFRFD
jgi:serine/threonine protein kinase